MKCKENEGEDFELNVYQINELIVLAKFNSKDILSEPTEIRETKLKTKEFDEKSLTQTFFGIILDPNRLITLELKMKVALSIH